MTKTLVIGAGGVGSVAVHKMAMCPDVFGDVLLASRRIAKCDDIAQSVTKRFGAKIETAELDADDTQKTIDLIARFNRPCCQSGTAVSRPCYYGCLSCDGCRLSGYGEL